MAYQALSPVYTHTLVHCDYKKWTVCTQSSTPNLLKYIIFQAFHSNKYTSRKDKPIKWK